MFILKLVIPANAGIHLGPVHMDSRLRGNDERASKPGFRMRTSEVHASFVAIEPRRAQSAAEDAIGRDKCTSSLPQIHQVARFHVVRSPSTMSGYFVVLCDPLRTPRR